MSKKNIGELLLLVFLPATLVEIGYIVFLNISEGFSLPNLNALALSVLFIMLPVMLSIILIYSKKELGFSSIRKMILYQNPLKPKKFVLYSIVLLCTISAIYAIAKPLDNYIHQNLFLFIPQKYILAANVQNHTKAQLLVTLFSTVFITGIVAPVIEEIYFRGFLLPRMEWMGVFAPIVNAFLFSLYHFWSPWQFATRTLFLIPLCYAAYKTKNVKLTIFVHCLLNILGDGIGILLMIIG